MGVESPLLKRKKIAYESKGEDLAVVLSNNVGSEFPVLGRIMGDCLPMKLGFHRPG